MKTIPKLALMILFSILTNEIGPTKLLFPYLCIFQQFCFEFGKKNNNLQIIFHILCYNTFFFDFLRFFVVVDDVMLCCYFLYVEFVCLLLFCTFFAVAYG